VVEITYDSKGSGAESADLGAPNSPIGRSQLQRLVLFGHLAVFWLLWSGYLVPTLLFYGLISCGVALAAAMRVGIADREALPFRMEIRSVRYVAWLLWEIVKSNIAVAKIILDPRLPTRPRIIRTPSSQRSDAGRVVFANSITLTPGTITLAVREHEIIVHALNDEFADDLQSGDMDRRVRELENLS
jgi:multicomponent Na+:H+ antiporter subunit E